MINTNYYFTKNKRLFHVIAAQLFYGDCICYNIYTILDNTYFLNEFYEKYKTMLRICIYFPI